AVPRLPDAVQLQPTLLADLRPGEPEVRPGGGSRDARRRLPVGARLPLDDARPGAARAALRAAHGILPPHPVPAARRVPQPPLAVRGAARAAVVRPGRIPVAPRPRELPLLPEHDVPRGRAG